MEYAEIEQLVKKPTPDLLILADRFDRLVVVVASLTAELEVYITENRWIINLRRRDVRFSSVFVFCFFSFLP